MTIEEKYEPSPTATYSYLSNFEVKPKNTAHEEEKKEDVHYGVTVGPEI